MIVVLVSGGLDSGVALGKMVNAFGPNEVTALSIVYGQKHVKELECARKLANWYQVGHIVKDLSEVFSVSNCSLLQHSTEAIKHESYAQQLQEMGGEGTVDTYVPFRNGLFLASAASIAYALGADMVVYGAHRDDAAGRAYPDCSKAFADTMNCAIREGTGGKVCLWAPFINYTKADIVRDGLELNVPFTLTWSCYEGGEKPCGVCGTCIDRANAFKINRVADPALK